MNKVYKLICFSLIAAPICASAVTYKIDPEHSFIIFKVSHLGISTSIGQMPGISGSLEYDDKDPRQCKVLVEVRTKSIDTNHPERDKHLRGNDFLDVTDYPVAKFTSSKCEGNTETGTVFGNLQIMDKTQPIKIAVRKVGEGKDPWGGHRAGFEGKFEVNRRDFGINYEMGPNTDRVQIEVYIEGIRT